MQSQHCGSLVSAYPRPKGWVVVVSSSGYYLTRHDLLSHSKASRLSVIPCLTLPSCLSHFMSYSANRNQTSSLHAIALLLAMNIHCWYVAAVFSDFILLLDKFLRTYARIRAFARWWFAECCGDCAHCSSSSKCTSSLFVARFTPGRLTPLVY